MCLNPLAKPELAPPLSLQGKWLSMGERPKTVRRNCLEMMMKMERTLQS